MDETSIDKEELGISEAQPTHKDNSPSADQLGRDAVIKQLEDPSKSSEEKLEVLGETGASTNLNGDSLPEDWPRIASTGVIDAEYKTKLKPGDKPIGKLSFELKIGDKTLDYLAVEHTSDPTNPQFAVIEERFLRDKPQAVLYEGPSTAERIPDRATAIKHGEKAFLVYFTQQHNDNLQQGEKPIIAESADLKDEVGCTNIKSLATRTSR